jgi:methylamine dehydrogenase light chain
MQDGDQQESKLDTSASRFLDNFAQRISRRGILARLGDLALAALGISLVPNLPLNRTFVAEANVGCDDWRLCGIWGWLCADCCGGNGSLTSCPSCSGGGTTQGSGSWSLCCPSGNDCGSKTITYRDCCGGTDTQAGPCQGTQCQKNINGEQPQWCNNGALGTYRCTIISVGGNC